MISELHPIQAVKTAAVYIENKLSSGVAKIRSIFTAIFADNPTRLSSEPVNLRGGTTPETAPSHAVDSSERQIILTPLEELRQKYAGQESDTYVNYRAQNKPKIPQIQPQEIADSTEIAAPKCKTEAFNRLTPFQQLYIKNEQAHQQCKQATDAAIARGGNVRIPAHLIEAVRATDTALSEALLALDNLFPEGFTKAIVDYKTAVAQFDAEEQRRCEHLANLDAIRKGK